MVITGTIPGIPRDAFDRWLKRQGCKLGKSVSRETEILIVAVDPGQSKLRAAQKRQADGSPVEIFELKAFAQLYGMPPGAMLDDVVQTAVVAAAAVVRAAAASDRVQHPAEGKMRMMTAL